MTNGETTIFVVEAWREAAELGGEWIRVYEASSFGRAKRWHDEAGTRYAYKRIRSAVEA